MKGRQRMNVHRNRRRLMFLCAALIVLGTTVTFKLKQAQSSLTAIPLPHGAVAVAIAGGEWASYALTTEGTVYAWGLNTRGQLGNGSTINSLAPMAVRGLPSTDPVVAIASGA